MVTGEYVDPGLSLGCSAWCSVVSGTKGKLENLEEGIPNSHWAATLLAWV